MKNHLSILTDCLAPENRGNVTDYSLREPSQNGILFSALLACYIFVCMFACVHVLQHGY